METQKRKDQEPSQEESSNNALVMKKVKPNDMALSVQPEKNSRTSNLAAPILLLSGHGAEVYSVKFSPTGKQLASCSFDKTILIWNVFGECKTTRLLKGHINAVLQVFWANDEESVFSASADKTVAMWDVETGTRIRKFVGHTGPVNTMALSKTTVPQWIISGSDDGTAKLWDARSKNCVETFSGKWPILSLSFNQIGTQFFSGSIDREILGFDLRKKSQFMTLTGHEDSVTGLRLSSDGNYLLSNSMDNTLRTWDIRPFVNGSRSQGIFTGHQHSFEQSLLRCSWSSDGSRVAGGSGDRFVYIWDVLSKKVLFKLPGHKGTVNDVDFHPFEPVVASASADKSIYLGELPF